MNKNSLEIAIAPFSTNTRVVVYVNGKHYELTHIRHAFHDGEGVLALITGEVIPLRPIVGEDL